jgi:hypothetical protein
MNIYKKDKKYLNINFIIENLNNYCKRNVSKKDRYEKDLEWASYLSKTREPFDEIILPDFSTESIIKLFTLKNEKNESDEGIFSINLMNNNKEEFYKEVESLSREDTIHNTISSIFEKAMKTLYTDTENIKNVEQIQKIYEEKYKKKEKIADVDIEVIKEIKENIQADIAHKQFLDFIIDLSKYLPNFEGKLKEDFTESMSIMPIPGKKEFDETDISFDPLSTSIKPDFSSSAIFLEKTLLMDDIFFIKDENWKKSLKEKKEINPEYKKYPSLLYFLFKNPKCEEELRKFLKKTDSIGKEEKRKFPTFLLILRIFSDINCFNFQINSDNFLGNLIKEEILLGIKGKSFDEFKKSKNINWLGLLINNSEINEYLSPKMNYIFHYLENLCDYSFKPTEESKKKIIK